MASDDETNDILGSLGNKSAARIQTRRGSKATEIRRLKVSQEHYVKAARRMKEQADNDDQFQNWNIHDIIVRIKKLDDIESNLNNINIVMGCEYTGEQSLFDDEIDDLIMGLRVKFNARLATFERQNDAPAPPIQFQPVRLQMPRTDATGNVPNTWGTFDGDYTQWKSFRDRWMLLHDNKDVKPIVKLQNLLTACIGAAESALGEWELVEENYAKAWERLQAIFEDDYMHILQLMRKLNSVPFIKDASSQTIRTIIGTVHKHIHGLSRYMTMDDKHPYIVANVIERMDAETYRAWEKYRTSLAKAKAKILENETNEVPKTNAGKSGKFFPTWTELEEFLEGEFSIRVHAEERDEANQYDEVHSAGRYKWFNKSNMELKPVMPLTAERYKGNHESLQNSNYKKAKISHSSSSGINRHSHEI